MGFIPDIERIFKLTPPRRQTLFFSATMPPEITRLTTQFLKDPTRLEASRPAMTAETITQYLVRIPSSDPKAKRAALRALIGRADVRNGIVFCNRKSEVDVVAKSLKQHGFDAAPIHGDLDQSLRMKTLAAFRSGELKLLVASDVAARGLDIPDVSHVFNYDVSHHADDYVHRIGRTGRAGKLGQTFMIVTPADDRSLDKVLKLIKMDPEELVLDGVDFAPGKEQPRRDAGRDTGQGERTPARGRSRREVPQGPTVEPAVAIAPEPATSRTAADTSIAEVTDVDSPRPRRTRSRRGSKVAAAEVAGTVETPIVLPAVAPVAAVPELPQDRPVQETHLRQSDRRGDNAGAEPQRSNGRPFGEGDIPAFLRRSVSLKS
jgi:superfamily II DNA/RNA helicase